MKRGWSQKEIAESIGVHLSTICRELQRNSDGISKEYSYDIPHSASQGRQHGKVKYTVITSKIKIYVKSKLKVDWLPEQIAGRMKIDKGVTVSNETIYRYIYYNKFREGRLYKYSPPQEQEVS